MANMTADDIRRAAIDSGAEVRAKTEQMPASKERDQLLSMMRHMEYFWRDASDEFCQQWLLVALSTS